LLELIRESGCIPVERDALYHTLSIHHEDVHCESAVS
jgi:hypothetical protein